LYSKGGKPIYVYNLLGLQRFHGRRGATVSCGKATIASEFAY